MFRPIALCSVPALLLGVLACSTPNETRPYKEQPPPSIKPVVVAYTDTDGFDSLLESSLLNMEPAILIQTENEKPNWNGRLNAWIAAWNKGGVVEAPERRPRVRMQSPIPSVVIDGNSIREFRLLIDDLMNRVDGLASEGSAWWKVDKVQRARVAMLKPYNLRFHIDAANHIQIILFNGQYPEEHRAFMQSIARPEDEESGQALRPFACSRCPASALVRRDPDNRK